MFRKVCAVLAAAVILIVVPVICLSEMNNRTVSEYIESRIVKFTAAAARDGKITKDRYIGLLREISATGTVCEANLAHMIPKEVLIADSTGEVPVTAPEAVGLALSKDYSEVYLGELPDITVYLVYSDESREDVTSMCTSNFNDSIEGLQNVTYSYLGYEAYATIFVLTETYCDICGSLLCAEDIINGCSVCKNTPACLMITPDYLNVYQNETPEITVIVCYMDGHLELTEDWEGNIDTSVPGEREVLIGYGGVVERITVNVIPKETETEICVPEDPPEETERGKEKQKETAAEANEKGSSNLSGYIEAVYTPEIIRSLISDGEYITDSGYLSVTVREKTSRKQKIYTYGGRM